MTGTSSCRPARLVRFEETLDAVADGLARRRGTLDDALAAYRAGCSVDYRVPTADTTEVLRGFGSGLRDFGHWVGDVGRAFESVAAAEAFMGSGGARDFEDVVSTEDDILLGYLRDELDSGEDPYRGIPEGMATEWADRFGLTYDQDEPPTWIGYLESGGNAADIVGPILKGTAEILRRLPEWASVTFHLEGSVLYVSGDEAVATAFAAQVHARVRLPVAYASRIATAARWVNGTGFGLALAGGAAAQWFGDSHLPTPQRVGRAMTRGVAVAGGGVAGGAVLGLACGPVAPVCGTVTGILGAFGGAWAGDRIADVLPWMEENEPLPAEHDLEDVTDAIGGAEEVDRGVAAAVDLAASDMVLESTADDPVFQERVSALLPDRERLEFIVRTGELPEDVTPTRTTTTTTTTVPRPTEEPSRDERYGDETIPDEHHLRDPWLTPRPY